MLIARTVGSVARAPSPLTYCADVPEGVLNFAAKPDVTDAVVAYEANVDVVTPSVIPYPLRVVGVAVIVLQA